MYFNLIDDFWLNHITCSVPQVHTCKIQGLSIIYLSGDAWYIPKGAIDMLGVVLYYIIYRSRDPNLCREKR